MTYVFGCIKEINTMRLYGMTVKSDIDRDIYAVRFIGRVRDIKKEAIKTVIRISDSSDEIEAMVYSKVSPTIERMINNIGVGDMVIVFAHLEPKNKICYVDIIRKIDNKEEICFLAGLFLTYFRYIFHKEASKEHL